MSQVDHFQRAPFAVDLIEMVKSLPTPFSFALDADWGAGKTFFINNVLGPEAKKHFPCLIYDAFEHEKEDDVFLSIMTSILEQSQLLASDSQCDNKAIQNLVKKTAKVATTIGGIALNAGTKLLLREGLEELVDKITESSSLNESVSIELEKEVTKFLQERLKNGQSYKAVKAEFQKSIKNLANNLSINFGKILVIIDELDRCTPHHALKVLEATHHLLNTEGLIFMFSYNRDQLEALVEHVYGKDIKAGEYLQKFVSLNFTFPTLDNFQLRSANSRLMEERVEMHGSNLTNAGILISVISSISKRATVAPMTPRQMQQYTSLFLMTNNTKLNKALNIVSHDEVAALMYWKLTKPKALSLLISPATQLPERLKIMEELQYDELIPQESHRQNFLADYLKEDLELVEHQRAEIYRALQVFNVLT